MSAVDVKSKDVKVKLIFNLWAPLAAKFEAPVALSVKDSSTSGVTNSSFKLIPILADAVCESSDNTSVWSDSCTNVPLI